MPDIQINGHRLHYTEQGEGPPVLLLHGLGSSSADWEYQLPALTPHYRVYTLDMRGHGRSQPSRKGYSIPTFAADTLAFIEQKGLTRPHIVGLSMGGMIAFQLAVMQPGAAASLTIVNSGPEVVARSLADFRMAAKRLLLAHLLPMSVMARGLARLLFPRPDQAALRATFLQRWKTNRRRPYLASLRAIVGWSVRQQLAQIHCPVLAISADHDYTPVADKQAWVEQLPDARLEVVSDSRHATPVDQPAAFNQLLLDFLQQQKT